MPTKKTFAALALATAVLMSTTSACSSDDQSGSEASTPQAVETDSIVGDWTMKTLEIETDGEFAVVPYSGRISFTEAGTLAVQAMNPDATAPDTAYTVNGYEAYYGNATIDEEAGTFSVDVTSAAVRDLIGQTLNRNFEISDDTLVLTPVDASEGFRVTYERETA